MIALNETRLLDAQQGFDVLKNRVLDAASEGEAIHVLERELWNSLLGIGRLLLMSFVDQHGKGDVGETVTLPDGRTADRLEEPKRRRYISVFGAIDFWRFVYGSREKQKHESVPLDAQLQLPANDTSYVLQDWDQSFCVQNPFGESASQFERILGLRQSVATLERMNQNMGIDAEEFQRTQGPPAPEEEASLQVITADGKGVPMRRGKDRTGAEENGPDEQPDDECTSRQSKNKKMAYVGAIYSIDPFVRSAEDIIDETLRKRAKERQPKPKNKRLRADLTLEIDAYEYKGRETLFQWLSDELDARNPSGQREVICLMDGEKALATTANEHLPKNRIDILDIMHALGKLRDAAHCFHPEGSDEAEAFVESRLRMLLEGKAGYVSGGLKQMATKHQLSGKKKKTIETVTTYYDNNLYRMRYAEYLAAGYPIGTGVVEGACKHLVKERMEGSGMRWLPMGAQAMLSLRAVYLNGDWEEFCRRRIENESCRLYPYHQATAALN